MKPVDQTLFGKTKGNCFAAVVASLLELSLDEVPNFCAVAKDASWWKPFLTWCAERGLTPIELDIEGMEWYPAEGQWCWLDGISPRNKDWRHAVVGQYKDGKYHIIHDPHPSRGGFRGEPLCVGFFILIDPIRRIP